MDFLLIRKMKNGDEKAMETFVRQYYPVILKYCRYHVFDAGYAEDVVQETFLRFFRALPEYQHYGKAVNYLYRIAGNLCTDFYRKNMEWRPLEEGEKEESPTENIENRLDVEQALHRLPEELREVIILHYFQDLKLREIAQIQKIGLSLVKYRLREAKRRLGSLLGQEETEGRR